MIITENEIRYIAKLARIGFDKNEISRITEDLEEIISFFNKLNELDTVNIENDLFDSCFCTGSRSDAIKDPLPREEIVKNAPAHNDTYIIVPSAVD